MNPNPNPNQTPIQSGAPAAQREITERTNLCDERGRLRPAANGWARHPVFHCNVTGHPFRKKKWDYWCVTNSEMLFSATISNLDYAAVIFVYILDLRTLQFHEQSVTVPFGINCPMPDDVGETVHYMGKDMIVSFENNKDGITRIKVRCDKFGSGTLAADLSIQHPTGHETLNVVVPWSNNRFQFTSKQNCLPTEGEIRWNDLVYTVNPDDSFGCLDFGRGVWPYQASWNWASASGKLSDSKTIGLTFGGQWTDGTGATENGIICNGHLSKIHEDIVWQYNKQNFMEPWQLHTSHTDQVVLTFEPLYERIAKTNALIIQSEVHQMIGKFSGTVFTDDGEKLEVKDLIGWAEDHHARW
ncbi:MAG: DUF2804 domain-containing protein [Candidatus Pristimantibacillus sp.]